MQGSIHIPASRMRQFLLEPVAEGKHAMSVFSQFAAGLGLPCFLIEDAAPMDPPEAEVHDGEGDLWHCLEGSATFVHGGHLSDGKERVRPDGSPVHGEWVGTHILGGIETIVEAGDWLWIPPGVPHAHWSDAVARMMVVKVPKRAA